MHAFLEADMGDKPALKAGVAIGPSLRAIAGHVLAEARKVLADPELSSQDAVHYFRRAMKEWRSLMRLLAPFIVDAVRWRREGRDYARALGLARDGQSALNAFDDLMKQATTLSERSAATIRERIEAIRMSEERAVLTPELRDDIIRWLDTAAAAVELWPVDEVAFSAIAERLTTGYRNARRLIPADWATATPEELHELRRRVVIHRYQMELIEPLWPRFGRMWTGEAERLRDRLGRCQDLEVLTRLTGPHQPLAHWRSRLAPACADRTNELVHRARRITARLFAERPKAFRARLESLWDSGH
jgi:CHAD domain-containing protein